MAYFYVGKINSTRPPRYLLPTNFRMHSQCEHNYMVGHYIYIYIYNVYIILYIMFNHSNCSSNPKHKFGVF